METNIYGKLHDHKREFERIDEAPITDQSKKLIKDYIRAMLLGEASDSRVVKLGAQLRRLAEWFKKDLDKVTKEDVERVVLMINQGTTYNLKKKGGGFTARKHSKETQADYKRCIKQFYKWLWGNGEEYPPQVKWVKSRVKLKDKYFVDDLIQPDDMIKVIQACTHKRDRAFLMFLYESGARISEILRMRIRDFWQDKHCARVRLRGKTGERVIPIVNSIPYLAAYLEEHPQQDTPSAPLWVSIGNYHKTGQLMYQGARVVINNAFAKAGIKKKHNPHLFRHSRASEMAKTLTEAQMCKYFGWVLGSEQVRTYVHMSGRDLDNSILEYNGIEVTKEQREDTILRKQTCPRCGLENGAAARFCQGCAAAMDTDTAISGEQLIQEESQNAMKYLMELMGKPELLAELEVFRRSQT